MTYRASMAGIGPIVTAGVTLPCVQKNQAAKLDTHKLQSFYIARVSPSFNDDLRTFYKYLVGTYTPRSREAAKRLAHSPGFPLKRL